MLNLSFIPGYLWMALVGIAVGVSLCLYGMCAAKNKLTVTGVVVIMIALVYDVIMTYQRIF